MVMIRQDHLLAIRGNKYFNVHHHIKLLGVRRISNIIIILLFVT